MPEKCFLAIIGDDALRLTMVDFEIVGIHLPGNGRTCAAHECCGKYLCYNDLIKVKLSTEIVDGLSERVGKIVIIKNGVETCMVGFLPRFMLYGEEDELTSLISSYVQVIELYELSENSYKKEKSKRLGGIALVRLLK